MWSISFIFLTDMFSLCCQKCGPGPKLFPRLDIFSTFRGIHKLIFTYVPYIVIRLHEEPANFYREKRSVAFVTSHLFTSQVVLSLIWLVTTQILICENQTIWRLEILLRTIVAALLKAKGNGRFVKYKRYPETGKEYFRIVWMIVKDEGYIYFAARATFDARSCPPSPSSAPQIRHTNQQEGHCLSDDLCPSHLQPTQPYFQFPQLPKKKRKFIPKVLKFHINRIRLYQYSTSPRYEYILKP